MRTEPPLTIAHLHESHDGGLASDLAAMHASIDRRRAVAMLASVGALGMLGGCGEDGSTPVGIAGSSSGSSGGVTITAVEIQCAIPYPAETSGPFPGDGTNNASGSAPTSNTLTINGILRSDIRSSFINSATVATGVPVNLTLQIFSSACVPLAGYAVYLWHCDANGQYSLYDVPRESYLRGLQVTDASGKVSFMTVYPGCYLGRYPHMHFEVFSNLASATNGRTAILTSQLLMPNYVSNAVYADTATYPNSATRYANTSRANDPVLGDNTTFQTDAMEPSFNGSTSSGYNASVIVRLPA